MNQPGTNIPANVTGDCPHLHKTPEAARRCIDDMDRAIKRGHGSDAYCDRSIIEVQVIRRGVIDKIGPVAF